MEEEEEDDLEISFKPSSITTFLPFPPVDSSAHLLNALTAKVGTYSQGRELLALSQIRLFKFLLKLPNSITHTYPVPYVAFKCPYGRNWYLLFEGSGTITHRTALTLAYQDLLPVPKHCLEVQIVKIGE